MTDDAVPGDELVRRPTEPDGPRSHRGGCSPCRLGAGPECSDCQDRPASVIGPRVELPSCPVVPACGEIGPSGRGGI